MINPGDQEPVPSPTEMPIKNYANIVDDFDSGFENYGIIFTGWYGRHLKDDLTSDEHVLFDEITYVDWGYNNLLGITFYKINDISVDWEHNALGYVACQPFTIDNYNGEHINYVRTIFDGNLVLAIRFKTNENRIFDCPPNLRESSFDVEKTFDEVGNNVRLTGINIIYWDSSSKGAIGAIQYQFNYNFEKDPDNKNDGDFEIITPQYTSLNGNYNEEYFDISEITSISWGINSNVYDAIIIQSLNEDSSYNIGGNTQSDCQKIELKYTEYIKKIIINSGPCSICNKRPTSNLLRALIFETNLGAVYKCDATLYNSVDGTGGEYTDVFELDSLLTAPGHISFTGVKGFFGAVIANIQS